MLTVVILMMVSSCQTKDAVNYSVAEFPWKEAYGNHRAILEIDNPAEAIELDLLWRRHDKNPQERRMLIVNAETGDTIQNIFRKIINNEKCNLIFGPVKSPGIYHFYYLPYSVQLNYGFYYKGYFIPEDEPDSDWIKSNKLNDPKHLQTLPQASCFEIQSRTELDSFYPMEVITTEDEKQQFTTQEVREFYLFPEDRMNPIRMKNDIPIKWLNEPLSGEFSGEALQNEYYVFQIGVWAADKDLTNLSVQFSDFNNGNISIPADKITCFNTEGVDPDGNFFEKIIDVDKTMVQALWIGVDIPKEIKPGKYHGWVKVKPENCEVQQIDVTIKVLNKQISDRGDSELWRHSRLRWLNSTAGIDKEAVKPFSPIQYDGENTFKLSGSNIKCSDSGLPKEIIAWGNQILSAPINTDINISNSKNPGSEFKKTRMDQSNGEIYIEYLSDNIDYNISAQTKVEFDGYLSYKYTIKAKENIKINNVELNIPLKSNIAEYMMGMGLPGTTVPISHTAKWEGPHDSFWIGNTYGGIYCELRGSDYHGPLLNLYKPAPPPSWYNNDQGRFSISRSGNSVIAGVSSGERKLNKGEEISFEFDFIITPIHQIDSESQFTDRYYHNGGSPSPSDDELKAGVKIINLHHANEFNPHINYPFIATEEMKGFIDKYHSRDKKVKIYYTIRELTNWVTEIWALRSLDDEIIGDGRGGGFPWLREHFIDAYTPQWYHRLDSTKVDASVLTSTGESRWFNYYIEGLAWLVENMDIDGLYLDDVSFDRRMLKRIRKVMEERKPGCILDLHSNTGFSKGPAIQYTDFFPYINKLWFGESFQYNEMPPENWLVEVSGIPFGLMGDMLHGGGNPWRGMIYGMTVRYPWDTEGVSCDPRSIWEIWDDFDIASSEMIGYWDKRSVIKTNHKDVLLSYYQHPGKILISIASWSDKTEHIRINADWKALGYDLNKSILSSPGIQNFQPDTLFQFNELVPIEPGKGWLLIVNKGN